MQCPYCNEEMKKGSIGQGDAMYPVRWFPEPETPPMLFYSNKGSVKLSSPWKSGRVVVYHCAGCRKFIIDQDELEV